METFKTLDDLTIIFGCPPEYNGKILWLKTPHVLFTGHVRHQLDIDFEAFSLLDFFHNTRKFYSVFLVKKPCTVLTRSELLS